VGPVVQDCEEIKVSRFVFTEKVRELLKELRLWEEFNLVSNIIKRFKIFKVKNNIFNNLAHFKKCN